MSRGKSNCNVKNNGNRKGAPRLAIVHVVMKSSSQAPPAAAHAEYIARENQYQKRGGLDWVESGNMPEFARDNAHSFWEAADAFERKNGRAYTELQIALPRELAPEARNELARGAARELMGERFAYTLAVHTPVARDNLDQPHMHLMFSERAIDERTRELSDEQFFKRNGAKKDPEWNARDKPIAVREKWVELMNAAMERAGHEQRLDARSWANQGREDLAALREPKLLAGSEAEAWALRAEVDELRVQRTELPAPHLGREAAVEKLEQEAARQIAEVEVREAQELSRLDRLIAAAREFATEVKDRTVAFARQVGQEVRERAGSLFGKEPREEQAEGAPSQKQQQGERAGPPSPEMQARLDELLAGLDRRIEARRSVDAKLADLDKRMDARAKVEREQAEALARRERERALSRAHEQAQEQGKGQGKSKGKEPEERGHSRGFGIER